MACKACERRRKALQEKLAAKKAKGQKVQAAAIGAVLTVTEAAGKALGIQGEETSAPDRPKPDRVEHRPD